MNEQEHNSTSPMDSSDHAHEPAASHARDSASNTSQRNAESDNATFSTLIALSPLISGLSIGLILNLFLAPVGQIFNMAAPIILWAIWKDKSPYVNKIGKNVVNSQISWGIWVCAATVLSYILMIILIGILTIWIAPALWLLFTIIHIIKVANKKDDYVMPLTIRFLK